MTTTQQQIIDALISGDKSYELKNAIDALPNSERIVIRSACIARGCKELPYNLYYNYELEAWIDY